MSYNVLAGIRGDDNLQLFYIAVGFDPSEYSVAERPGGFVTLTVTRSGNIDLTANVTLLTLQGSADGRPTHKVKLCQ